MKLGIGFDIAVRCYPKWWQDRYGPEVRVVSEDLMKEGRSEAGVTLNLLRGAIRARTGAAGMPRSLELWRARTRSSVAVATLPWVVVFPLMLWAIGTEGWHVPHGHAQVGSWTNFLGLSVILGSPNTVVVHGGQVAAVPPLTTGGTVAVFAGWSLLALVVVTLLVFLSGWTGLLGAIKRSPSPNRQQLRQLARVPGYVILASFLLSVLAAWTAPHSSGIINGHTVTVRGNLELFHIADVALRVLVVGGWLLSIICVGLAARRADIDTVDLRFGRSVSVAVSLLSLLTVAACGALAVGLVIQSREAAHGAFSTISYPHAGVWPVMLGAVLLTAALSWGAATAARRSWRVVAALADCRIQTGVRRSRVRAWPS
jgi:hypothetical protein